MALEYLSAGTAVTDRKLHFTIGKTIDGTGYFMSRIPGVAAHSVIGTSSATYGVWVGTGQSGDRYNVFASGVPTDTREVLWDLQSGRVYRTEQGTAYARYYEYGHLQNEGRVYSIDIPKMLEGTVSDTYISKCPWNVDWGEYAISVLGNRPNSTMDLGLHNATGGGTPYATLTIGTASAGNFHTSWQTISGGLEMDTDDYIVIRTSSNASGFSLVRIDLRERLV